MKKIICLILLSGVILTGCKNTQTVKMSTLQKAEEQLDGLRKKALMKQAIPRSADPKDGSVRWVVGKLDWTEGFFPGTCWLMYQYSQDPKWKESAVRLQQLFLFHKDDRSTHDLGFIFNNSFGKAYRLTGDESYKDVVLEASKSLISRYNPRIGCIKSWDWAPERWTFPVIIDNMMNLEMLFEAFQLTGDSTYYNIACQHANTTRKNHFRQDHSSYHVVDYALDGKVLRKLTHQGYADESAWSRGQAWGLYGFTMCYRYTKDPTYLRQAEEIADFLISSLPKDKILPWDLRAPDSLLIYKDASASAIMASALIELSSWSQIDYVPTAQAILSELSSRQYFAEPGTNQGFLLKHSVGSYPETSEVDVAISYADYYFLEGLLRLKKLRENKKFDYTDVK